MDQTEAYGMYRRSKVGGLLYIGPIAIVWPLAAAISNVFLMPCLILLLMLGVGLSKVPYKFAALAGLFLAMASLMKDFSSLFGFLCLLISIGLFVAYWVYEFERPSRIR